MNVPQFVYTEEEWEASAGHQPLRDLDLPELMLLHRHWIWANRERELFDAEIRDGRIPAPDNLVEAAPSAMFLWYALLWSVIEAFDERRIELRGRFAEDIASVAEALRRCRNAVLHVSREAYYDERLFELMEDEDSAAKIRRISSGLGRLYIEEFEARRVEQGDGA